MARRNTAEVLTGAAVLVAAGIFLLYAVANSGRGGTAGYTLTARFDRIDGLGVGSDVRLAGVKVGAVTDAMVDPGTFMAEVTFTVRSGIALPKDSSARSEERRVGKECRL